MKFCKFKIDVKKSSTVKRHFFSKHHDLVVNMLRPDSYQYYSSPRMIPQVTAYVNEQYEGQQDLMSLFSSTPIDMGLMESSTEEVSRFTILFFNSCSHNLCSVFYQSAIETFIAIGKHQWVTFTLFSLTKRGVFCV